MWDSDTNALRERIQEVAEELGLLKAELRRRQRESERKNWDVFEAHLKALLHRELPKEE